MTENILNLMHNMQHNYYLFIYFKKYFLELQVHQEASQF